MGTEQNSKNLSRVNEDKEINEFLGRREREEKKVLKGKRNLILL